MNAPTRVAQLTGAASGSKPVKILKIEKPASGQAVVAEASYDGTVKVEFGAIANEKITLVHVGETLIILFDNQSTVTIIPFFDSMGVPLANISIETNGKEFSSQEFASTFPITTDQSVLPAAGDGNGTPAAGANFSNASVDPLTSPGPLPLLGPEELPGIEFTRFEGAQPVDQVPETFDSDPVAIDEDDITGAPHYSQGIGNTDSPGDDQPINVHGTLNFFPGTPGVTIDFAEMHNDPVEGADSLENPLALKSQGHDLVYKWDEPSSTLKAVWADDITHVVFQIVITDHETGAYTLTLFDQLDHPYTDNPDAPSGLLGFEDNLLVDLIYTVTDGNGSTDTGSVTIDFDDDMPRVTGAVESRIVDEDDIKTAVVAGHEPGRWRCRRLHHRGLDRRRVRLRHVVRPGRHRRRRGAVRNPRTAAFRRDPCGDHRLRHCLQFHRRRDRADGGAWPLFEAVGAAGDGERSSAHLYHQHVR